MGEEGKLGTLSCPTSDPSLSSPPSLATLSTAIRSPSKKARIHCKSRIVQLPVNNNRLVHPPFSPSSIIPELAPPRPSSSLPSPSSLPPITNPDSLSPLADGVTLGDGGPPLVPPLQFFLEGPSGTITTDWGAITSASQKLATLGHDFAAFHATLTSPCYRPGSEFRTGLHMRARGFDLPDDFVDQVSDGGSGNKSEMRGRGNSSRGKDAADVWW